jgi:hypothetical protein
VNRSPKSQTMAWGHFPYIHFFLQKPYIHYLTIKKTKDLQKHDSNTDSNSSTTRYTKMAQERPKIISPSNNQHQAPQFRSGSQTSDSDRIGHLIPMLLSSDPDSNTSPFFSISSFGLDTCQKTVSTHAPQFRHEMHVLLRNYSNQ